MVWYGTEWYGMVWYEMERHIMVLIKSLWHLWYRPGYKNHTKNHTKNHMRTLPLVETLLKLLPSTYLTEGSDSNGV